MINTSASSLLMIEPSANVSAEPVIDGLTLRMAAALLKARSAHAATPGGLFTSTRGWHTASSGAMSDSLCWKVYLGALGAILPPCEVETNSLAVHYLAWSRHEIPQSEIEKLHYFLPIGELADPEDPAVLELVSPRGFKPPAQPAAAQEAAAAEQLPAYIGVSRDDHPALPVFRDWYRRRYGTEWNPNTQPEIWIGFLFGWEARERAGLSITVSGPGAVGIELR